MTTEEILKSKELNRCVDEFTETNGLNDLDSEEQSNMIDCFILGYVAAMKEAGICERLS